MKYSTKANPRRQPLSLGEKMTTEQKEAVKNAKSAFIAAMEEGVEEFFLIEEIFDASNAWKISKLTVSEKSKTHV
jgi:hypothetical protein